MCNVSIIFEQIFQKGKQTKILMQKNKLIVAVVLSFIVSVMSVVTIKPVWYSQSHENVNIESYKSIFLREVDGKIVFLDNEDYGILPEKEFEQFRGIFVKKESELEKELYAIVGEHPIKEMVPYIAKKDRKVAGFLVGIAKKESNWGKRVPTQNNQDCYNYWGYKGIGTRGSSMGYSCFSSPEEAVGVVGGRLEKLVGKNLNTPSRMIVWKCGSSCVGHDPIGVQKWISDVGIYFDKISNKKV